ncbi:hypothetical protein GCM10007170_42310 [Arthrobacter liuii]|uniref:PPE family C-terminal domain-containing protein n=1 Tax=Arthrobacter liuii TaxID=1476996 RepID=A0ABQ2B0M3_9MICC|nr:hypothetical protein GCM10007170_42310 [Arthrobacter liuii]
MVTQVVPAAAGPVISHSVAEVENHVATGIANAVVAPLSDTVTALQPALEPVTDPTTLKLPTDPAVLEPLTDLVAGNAPSPFTPPEALTGADPGIQHSTPDPAGEVPGGNLSSPPGASMPVGMATPSSTADTVTAAFMGITGTDHRTPQFLSWHGDDLKPMLGKPWSPRTTVDPSLDEPALPGSAGSNARSASSSGPAAWLSSHVFDIPVAGLSQALGYSGHAPTPVSLDPGSFPD